MSDIRLTDAQIAEVRRRRADPNRKTISRAEVRERIVASRMKLVFDDYALADLEGIFDWDHRIALRQRRPLDSQRSSELRLLKRICGN
jgi:hypothetical protein